MNNLREWMQLLGLSTGTAIVLFLLGRLVIASPFFLTFFQKSRSLKAELEDKLWNRLNGQWEKEIELNREYRAGLELLQADLKTLRRRYEEVQIEAHLAKEDAAVAKVEAEQAELRFAALNQRYEVVLKELLACEYPHDVKALRGNVAESDSDG